jgi:hypothetical protein
LESLWKNLVENLKRSQFVRCDSIAPTHTSFQQAAKSLTDVVACLSSNTRQIRAQVPTFGGPLSYDTLAGNATSRGDRDVVSMPEVQDTIVS